MAKIFISYSRKDTEFTKRLAGELEKNGLDFWVDWEGIPPTVDWWKQIEKGIEEADIFLFLISPDSAASKVCAQEIDCAIKNGKRLIPLVVRDIKGDEAPKQLGHINWIFFRANDDFDAAFSKLLTGIQTDYEWAATHRRLQVKALEWERINKENSFLLRGKDLQDAELQLATNTSKEPHPTDLQREYVLKSRQAADRQRRIATGISVAGIIALAALAVFGFLQAGLATNNANEANRQASVAKTAEASAETAQLKAEAAQLKAEAESRIANSGRLALESKSNLNDYPQRSLLLAIEALRVNQNANEPVSAAAEEALRLSTERVSGVGLPGLKHQVSLLQFTKDDQWLVAGTVLAEGEIKIWNFNKLISDPGYQPFYLSFPVDANGGFESGVRAYLSPQTTWLVVDNQADTQIWKINSQDEVREAISFQGSIEFPNKDDDSLILDQQNDKVVIWKFDLETSEKKELKTFQGSFVARSQDAKYIITDDPQQGLLLWNFASPSTPPILLTANHSSRYISFMIDPNNRWLILLENVPHEDIQIPAFDEITYVQNGTKAWNSTDFVLIPLGNKNPQEFRVPLNIAVDLNLKPIFSPDGNFLVYNGGSAPDSFGYSNQAFGILKFSDLEFLNSNTQLSYGSSIFEIAYLNADWLYLYGYDSSISNYFSQFLDLQDGDLFADAAISSRLATDTNGKLLFSSDGTSLLTDDGDSIDLEQLFINHSLVLIPPDGTSTNETKSDLQALLETNPQATGLEDWPVITAQSSDNNWFTAGVRDGSIRLWNNQNPWINSSIHLPSSTSYIAFSNDNQWMAINNQLWQIKDGKPEVVYLFEKEAFFGISVFSPDSHWLTYVNHFQTAEGISTAQIKLIDLNTLAANGDLKTTVIGNGDNGSTFDKILFSADSHWLTVDDGQFFADGKAALFIYDLQNKKQYKLPFSASAFYYTQDQQHLVLQTTDPAESKPQIWALPTQQKDRLEKIWEADETEYSVISRDGHWLLSLPIQPEYGGKAIESKLWDLNCFVEQKECKPFVLAVNSAGFSPNSNYLLIGYKESIDSPLNYEVWDLTNSPAGVPQKIYSNKTRQNIPSISKDGNLIVFGSSLMSTGSAVLFGTWNGYDAIGYNVTTYDGYGKLVFGGGGGGGESIGSTKKDYAVDAFTIEDITADPSIRPLSLRGHESNISTSQISPDEKLILTYSGAPQDDGGTAENLLRLWEIDKMRADPTTKGVILPLVIGKDSYIEMLAFSPDSRWIYVVDSNNTLHYFPTSIETLENQACAAVGRNFIINEWERFFPNENYRKTCENLPEHPSAISP